MIGPFGSRAGSFSRAAMFLLDPSTLYLLGMTEFEPSRTSKACEADFGSPTFLILEVEQAREI